MTYTNPGGGEKDVDRMRAIYKVLVVNRTNM